MVHLSLTPVLCFAGVVNIWTPLDPFTTFFLSTGYALDPSVDIHQVSSSAYIGAVDEAEKNKGNNSRYFFFSCVCLHLPAWI